MKLLKLLLVAVLTLGVSCTTTNVSELQRIENRSYAGTWVVATKLLREHPDWRDELTIAREDLRVLENSTNVVALPVLLEIISRLPEKELGDAGLYIQGGLLFFIDDLGRLAVNNPPGVRASTRGMRRALDAVLQRAE